MANAFFSLPVTKPGRWSAGLAVAFVVMFLINSFVFMPASSDAPWRHVLLPFYGIAMLLCGLATGMMGLVALIRQQERSWVVWIAILSGMLVLIFVLGEIMIPH